MSQKEITMDARLWQQLVLYRRRVYHFKEKYGTGEQNSFTLETVIELTTIIPEVLLADTRIKLTPFIEIENNFEDIIDYLNWLDSLVTTVKNKEYFKTEQHNVLTEHRELSLEAFLTNKQGMMYYPYVIIDNIRSKLMRLKKEVENLSDNPDLQDYYNRRIKGFINVIAQPVFAIGELAGFTDE